MWTFSKQHWQAEGHRGQAKRGVGLSIHRFWKGEGWFSWYMQIDVRLLGAIISQCPLYSPPRCEPGAPQRAGLWQKPVRDSWRLFYHRYTSARGSPGSVEWHSPHGSRKDSCQPEICLACKKAKIKNREVCASHAHNIKAQEIHPSFKKTSYLIIASSNSQHFTLVDGPAFSYLRTGSSAEINAETAHCYSGNLDPSQKADRQASHDLGKRSFPTILVFTSSQRESPKYWCQSPGHWRWTETRRLQLCLSQDEPGMNICSQPWYHQEPCFQILHLEVSLVATPHRAR